MRLDEDYGRETKRFYVEDPQDRENSALFVRLENGAVVVTTAEERAVGSYNDSFACSFVLTKSEVESLCAFLAAKPEGA